MPYSRAAIVSVGAQQPQVAAQYARAASINASRRSATSRRCRNGMTFGAGRSLTSRFTNFAREHNAKAPPRTSYAPPGTALIGAEIGDDCKAQAVHLDYISCIPRQSTPAVERGRPCPLMISNSVGSLPIVTCRPEKGPRRLVVLAGRCPHATVGAVKPFLATDFHTPSKAAENYVAQVFVSSPAAARAERHPVIGQ